MMKNKNQKNQSETSLKELALIFLKLGTFAFGGSDAGSLLEQGRQFAFVVGHGHLPK